MNIANIIESNQGGTILFLGRVTSFTSEELTNFLEAQGVSYANKYNGEEVTLLVLSSMMTPFEEDLSYELYDAKVPDVTLKAFEEYYTTHIKPNTLLMSLKLSNDQERLKRLLTNEAFSDEVYLKLFKMYDWQGEGIHENDENRDITISFVKRFYKPDGFRDPAMIYAPTTVMNIAQESCTPEVLDAILTFPNHQIKVSRYESHRPKNLRETIAFNEAVSQESIKKLMGYRDEQLEYFLASNSALRASEQEILYGRSKEEVKLMLAHNDALSDGLFERLLTEGDEVVKSLLRYQKMSLTRLALVEESPFIAYLGANKSIGEMVEPLLALNNRSLDFQLASNALLSSEQLRELYHKYGQAITEALAENSNLSEELFYELYALDREALRGVLATNPATPKKILDELCKREDRALNRLLASNPSVDIYYLRRFQLDTSLIRILADNETYGKSILQGLGI
jgi:hypothetical protein